MLPIEINLDLVAESLLNNKLSYEYLYSSRKAGKKLDETTLKRKIKDACIDLRLRIVRQELEENLVVNVINELPDNIIEKTFMPFSIMLGKIKIYLTFKN
jgi:hypothetical protein